MLPPVAARDGVAGKVTREIKTRNAVLKIEKIEDETKTLADLNRRVGRGSDVGLNTYASISRNEAQKLRMSERSLPVSTRRRITNYPG
jgi:hypothetical protein